MQKTQYIRDLETAMMISGIRAEFTGLFDLVRRIPNRRLQNALGMKDRIDQYGLLAIDNHKTFVQKNPGASPSLFARFLDPDKHQDTVSDRELAQEAGNLIVAGSDTTSISLTYLTYALLRPCNKHILTRLKDEVAHLDADAPAKEILALPHLKKVVEESLRLYAGGSSLPRAVPPGGVTMGGYYIPPGITVSTQVYSLVRNQEIFAEPEK